jgi:thiamine pyrophosphate-dependent acetolactate synthase large subunit-like protein
MSAEAETLSRPANDLNSDPESCAAWIAKFLQARRIDRIFGLQGGHIQPIWDHVARLGIRIVDCRHEGAAVHMAHAHAELTGMLGVAMVTAGPGVTNTVTSIANASLARIPVLVIGGCTSRPQANMGPLQDIPHTAIIAPVARYCRTARVADQVIREMDEAVARAMGDLGEPGPAYIEIPTDVLRAHVAPGLVLDDWMRPKPPRTIPPDPAAVAEAAKAILAAKRPLVVTGRGARGAGAELLQLLDASGAVYLDTQESRGLVPGEHPSGVGAMRGVVMGEADLVVVIGRKLDYQLGYGSPAVYPDARFIRIADNAGELVDNRRGAPELLATPALALAAIVQAMGNQAPATDRGWADGLRRKHLDRSSPEKRKAAPAKGSDGKVHPAAIFEAIRDVAEPDYIAIADGGDLLSFARVGLEAKTYLDAGAFGCLGVGVPYAVAAALAFPDRQVIAITGDGAYGLNAMEIDSAVRHGAKAVFIVSNNAAWNIERYDQEENYGGRVVGTVLRHSDYAGMAKSLGLHGERVEDPADLAAALRRALDNAPALIDVVTSQTAVSSDARKGLGFVPDYQPLTAWDDAERRRRGLL